VDSVPGQTPPPSNNQAAQGAIVAAANVSTLKKTAVPGRTPSLEERNAFLYEQIVILCQPEKKVRAEANSKSNWPKLGGRQSSWKAVDAYIASHKLPERPAGRTGRPPKMSTDGENVNQTVVDKG
jgi:hypothetical protein